jgi:hypothetical protein
MNRFPDRQGLKSAGPTRPARPAYNRPGGRELIKPNPKLKLLDQVREVLRLKHYSIRTEREGVVKGSWH